MSSQHWSLFGPLVFYLFGPLDFFYVSGSLFNSIGAIRQGGIGPFYEKVLQVAKARQVDDVIGQISPRTKSFEMI